MTKIKKSESIWIKRYHHRLLAIYVSDHYLAISRTIKHRLLIVYLFVLRIQIIWSYDASFFINALFLAIFGLYSYQEIHLSRVPIKKKTTNRLIRFSFRCPQSFTDLAVVIGNEIDFFARNESLTGQANIGEAVALTGVTYDDTTRTMYLSDTRNNVSIFSNDLTKRNFSSTPLLKSKNETN